MSKLKVSGIELETSDGTSVTLTIEEAKELHDQLHKLFGKTYVPSAPIYIRERQWPWCDPWVTYGDNTGSISAKGPSGLSVTYSGESTDG